ncbi:MAG: YCF48-related protein [Pyrinomonadaceae bacterium]
MNEYLTPQSVIALKGPIVSLVARVCTSVLLLICMMACTENERTDYSNLEDRPQIKSAAFVGSGNAWLVSACEGQLMVTKNGGESWSSVPGNNIGGRFESIGFVDEKRGFATNSKGEVWSSGDGGQTWAAVSQLRSVKSHDWEFMSSNQINFADEQRGWIVETFTIWRTDDSGRNWQQVFSVLDPRAEGQPREAHFLNREIGWVTATSEGQIYQTTDGGNTWHLIPIAKNTNITDVFFISQNTGWVSGFASVPPYTKLYRSDDAGKTWLPLPSPDGNFLIISISFVSAEEGWAAGRVWTGDPKTSTGAVLHTLDRGQSWQPVQLRQGESVFNRVHFVNSQQGWLFGGKNVYRTEDSGRNWRVVLKLSGATNGT